MSDENYEIWEKEATKLLDEISSGLSNIESSLEIINQNLLDFEFKFIPFKEYIGKLDSADSFSLPTGIQSVFQNISNALSQTNLRIVEFGHDLELAITLGYLSKVIQVNSGNLPEIEINGITINIRPEGEPKIFTRSDSASDACHIVGSDRLGIEIKLSINFRFSANNIEFDETSNPTLHLTLTTSPINANEIQLSLTRGVRLCNQQGLKQSFERIFVLPKPLQEEYRVTLENKIVQAVSDTFPKTFSLPSIPKNELIQSTSIYNSYIQNYTRFFIQSKKRARQKFTFIQSLPNWAELAIKIDEQLIINLIEQEVKKQDSELEGSPVIRPLENAINFIIKKNVSKSRRIRILGFSTKVGVNVNAFIDFKLTLKVTASKKVRYDIAQVGEVRTSDPQVDPIDVTDVPLVGDFIDEVIEEVVKLITEIALILAGSINGEFDIFPDAERLELLLQSDRLIIFAKGIKIN